MEKFIINHKLNSFKSTTIDDLSLRGLDKVVILVLDDTTNDSLQLYYNNVINIMLSGARLIAIELNKQSKIRKAIFMLMALYRNYNIYRVDSSAIITEDYVETLIDREPDITEIQQYIVVHKILIIFL